MASAAAAASVAFGQDDAGRLARAYVAAVSSHSPSRICAFFTPELKRWVAQHGQRRDCPRAVSRQFAVSYGNRRWRDAHVVAVDAVTTTGELTEVRMRVQHHYVCRPHGCSRRSYRFPTRDILHLLRRNGRLLVAKPDVVLRSTSVDVPDDAEEAFYPPGDPSTVATPASIPPPGFACSGRSVGVTDPAGDIDFFQDSPRSAPWLDVRRLNIQSNGSTACFTLVLAAAPRPASSYLFSITWLLGSDVSENMSVGLDVDARGGLHPLIGAEGALSDPRVARYLPRYGLADTALIFELTRRQGLDFRHGWLVGARANSLQPAEPLLPNPLSAEDSAPGDQMDGGCLRYPRGDTAYGGGC